MKSVPLDDLPTHSSWTTYLLGGIDEPPRDPSLFAGTETYDDIYEHLLRSYRENSPSYEEFVRQTRGSGRNERELVSVGEELFLVDDAELVELDRTVVRGAVEPVLDGGETVLDLGCGWGWTLGTIADAFPDAQIVGGEYSTAGVELARELHADDDRISVEQFDFHGDWRILDAVADDADTVVFTKGVFPTLPEAGPTVERFEKLVQVGDVQAGAHLEQVGPHPETVLGILRERYARERDYSMDLLDELGDASPLTVTNTAYDVLGDNPLHPLTEIRWQST
ncbi:hypothetical protein BRD05_02580 [Halobacteriales archaeon QS_9_70_65]|nr:MAG: hypothetical protein BRD05_02580 [Halobacteriales archaeon QS_9_70_65]